ncbi:MAG: DUF2760 domain-containing protein [Desulfuromonadaceae bacterium]|nr:DUF2760 domain-containing protein [Desulfuromonas sp.]MDY0185382.1 DUF2760 domain-containing protein [Desulfuromonadaceae bacterium]
MAITLTLLTIGVISTLFYGSVPENLVPQLEWAALALPLALLLWQLIELSRKAAKEKEETEALADKPPPRAAALQQDPRQLQDAAVLQFLARLQEKGRLIDFVMDDMTPYADEQVGAAARIVHQGCQEVLSNFFRIEPLHDGAEEEEITLAQGYDSAAYRLVGSVPEYPPYTGVLLHRGWVTHSINLPQVSGADLTGSDEHIIAPAEVEIDPSR